MLGAGEKGQHALGVGLVGGLAEDLAREGDGGVGGEHGLPLQAAAHHDALPRGIDLEAGHAAHVVVGLLAGLDVLARFAVVAVALAEEQRLELDADLLQQLAAAGATGGKVDHGSCYSR